MKNKWKDISYLNAGTVRQRQAFDTLKNLNVMEILKPYNPILVGTIPINIDIKNSDLDIICEVYNLDEFEELIYKSFSKYKDFSVERQVINGVLSSFSSFDYKDFTIEIFGQPKPVLEQNAYCHMEIESRLLEIYGEELRKEIIKLKESGLKTEPAFAKYFNITGDPFDELLKLFKLSNEELRLAFKSH